MRRRKPLGGTGLEERDRLRKSERLRENAEIKAQRQDDKIAKARADALEEAVTFVDMERQELERELQSTTRSPSSDAWLAKLEAKISTLNSLAAKIRTAKDKGP